MKYLLTIFLSIFVIACSNSESAYSNETSSNDEISTFVEPEGMIRLESGFTTIGSNDKNYKAIEKPAMKVVLDYDFYMGIHEVTCGEYVQTAKKTELKTFGKCENDSLPLTDITYYDAILFANAKSKLEERDTVYTYRSAIFDDEKHCTNLEGFAFHADVEGYRLPTEAEWVYAATRAWDVKKSWNSENSEYKLHSVCSMKADSAGFCDMAGNAMEWVNDWMGAFRDTTVTNYAGAPDGGDLGERIVKGGCYSFSENELNPYSRGDVYSVTSATRAEYVGFRLALGSIPSALWMNDGGMSVTNIVIPLVGPETIKNLAGTYNAKLAFRNDVSENIAYLDYRNGTLSIKEITKGINAYHPEISPDGNWIAYCTGFEGVSGKSEIYVQSLENEPKQIKLKAESAAIPRWRVLENGDTVIIYVNDAGNNKDETTFKGTSSWQVKFANGNFGTPQKLFDGAYHGGISKDLSLAVSGARILRARISKKNVVWYDSAQACNVTLSQDGTKRTAFLDFGGKPGKKFVGKSYATHERIFIADSTGKLIQSIVAPNGYTFDHSEWATDGEKSIIIATLTNMNGAHTKIALVNPLDNSITELVEGEELWHPNLWIKKVKSNSSSSATSTTQNSSNSENNISSSSESIDSPEPEFELDPDSAGMYYNTSEAHPYAIKWRYKMELLWQYKDTANIIILGSSRANHGINPLLINPPFYAVNLSVTANLLGEDYELLINYVLPHMTKAKIVITTVDLDRWHTAGSGIWVSAYKSYPGYVYDKNHNYWKDQFPKNLSKATYNSPGNAAYAAEFRPTRGFSNFTSNGWGNPIISRDSTWMESQPQEYDKNLNTLIGMIEACQQKGITLIGVITPQNPSYKETGSFGRYGLLRSQAPQLIEQIANLNQQYPNFILMDENKMGSHDYTDEMTYNSDHLAAEGATQLTARIDSLIKTLNIEP